MKTYSGTNNKQVHPSPDARDLPGVRPVTPKPTNNAPRFADPAPARKG